MGTSYEKIYDSFLGKIKDPDLLELEDYVAEHEFRLLLDSAIPYFIHCKKPLILDDVNQSFTEELNNDETNILSTLMKREWWNLRIADTDVATQKWAESDFEFKSQASHLNALSKTKVQNLDKEIKTLMSLYSRKGRSTKFFNYKNLVGK